MTERTKRTTRRATDDGDDVDDRNLWRLTLTRDRRRKDEKDDSRGDARWG
jgi:hypothetical protein